MGMRLPPDLERKVLAMAGGDKPKRKAHRTKPDGVNPVPVQAPAASVLTLTVWIPGLVVRSEANIRDHMRAKIGRKAKTKRAVRAAFLRTHTAFTFPVAVALHRVGKKKLDTDNLAYSMKVVRDMVAEEIGVDDGDESKVTWQYSQSVGKPVGVRITISEEQA